MRDSVYYKTKFQPILLCIKNTLPLLSFSSTFYFRKTLTLLEFNMAVVVTGTLTLVACLTYYNILKIIPQ